MRPPRPGRPEPAELRERLRGLPPALAVQMREALRLLEAGQRAAASLRMLDVADQAPDHPEVLYWQGLRHSESQDWGQACLALRRAAEQRGDDFRIWHRLAQAQGRLGEAVGARNSLAEAARCARSAGQWLDLSIECDAQGHYDEALVAANATLRLEPSSARGRLQRARCHKALGDAAAAAADCRALIANGREVARAWFSLTELKTVRLDAAELRRLQAEAARGDVPPGDRPLLDFALGKALEDAGEYAAALAALDRANRSIRARAPWDAPGFAQRVQSIRAAFLDGPVARGADQGREVVFIVGLPRSGSTLVEQVLAAHSQVEGASELPYLPQVIESESRRRGRPFPAWATQASADDWTRLGQEYLRLSARWRLQRPLATDKLPDNWMYAGAIRAMLPQARIIECRRDPLETCWSCYKQLFAPGLANFSYDYASLAQYWQACETLGELHARAHPAHFRIQRYETLARAPEPEIRAILEFCGLTFEPGCLDFRAARRAVRTPSALQVRQPVRGPSQPAERLGELLNPLRDAIDHAGAGRSS